MKNPRSRDGTQDRGWGEGEGLLPDHVGDGASGGDEGEDVFGVGSDDVEDVGGLGGEHPFEGGAEVLAIDDTFAGDIEAGADADVVGVDGGA